jgi:membrane protease YdiL (CAAX protease family)
VADAGSFEVSEPPPLRPEERLGKPVKRRPWAPLHQTDAMVGFILIFLGLILAGGIVVAVISEEPARTLVALIPQGLLFVGVPIAIASKRVASRPWRVVGYTSFRARDLWLVAAAMGVQIAVTIVFTQLFFTPDQDTLVEDVDFNETTLAAVATVFLICVAAPVTEETLFRGLFFGALRTRAPFWVAGGASGLLFGAVHLASGDVAVAGLLAFFGVILAWLYERTGSLGPPILLHMVNNAIAIIPLLSG